MTLLTPLQSRKERQHARRLRAINKEPPKRPTPKVSILKHCTVGKQSDSFPSSKFIIYRWVLNDTTPKHILKKSNTATNSVRPQCACCTKEYNYPSLKTATPKTETLKSVFRKDWSSLRGLHRAYTMITSFIEK